jgi:isoquinoline 1-oxidoreductase beta subunit
METLARREFLKRSALGSAALVLGFSLTPEAHIRNLSGAEDASLFNPNPFLYIGTDGKIILMAHKPEMGQGTFQSVPLILAEELDVPLEMVEVRMAQGDEKYGNQSVGGSASVKTSWMPMRKAGAAARQMLIMAAAAQWGVKPEDCSTDGKGNIINGIVPQQMATYASVAAAAAKLEVPKEPPLKEATQFRWIGKETRRPDIPPKCDGTAQFGIDAKVPGMLYASVERAPLHRAKVKKWDDTRAKNVKGVKHVIACERQAFGVTTYGVAVLADSYWAALQGRKQLRIEWDNSGIATFSNESLRKEAQQLAKTDGLTDHQEGNVAEVFAQAAEKGYKTIESFYECSWAAHAPMEPMNCTIDVRENACEVWIPTQVPSRVRNELATFLNIPKENITIHCLYMGGGFGRRLFVDFMMEAAYLSRAVKAPVKLIWTREDDMTQGPFRPGTFGALRGAVDAQGNPLAMEHKVIAPSISYEMFPERKDLSKVDKGVMEGISEHPYQFPNFRTSYIYQPTTVPIGWWRAVYSSTTCFAHECFIDEMAYAAGKDPLHFRLAMVGEKHPRIRTILQTLAEKSGWDNLPKDKGKGVAVWQFFAGMCGQVCIMRKDSEGKPVIEKIIAVIDCGTAVNPDNVRAQVEGSIVMGLTQAIKDEIIFKDGVVVQNNFNSYRLLRMQETPPIEVHIVPSAEPPIGVGEPGLPPVAPALANAYFALTGKRERKMPFTIGA